MSHEYVSTSLFSPLSGTATLRKCTSSFCTSETDIFVPCRAPYSAIKQKAQFTAETPCAAENISQSRMRKMFTLQAQAVDAHPVLRQTDKRMDGSYSEEDLAAMWSSCPHLDMSNRALCQNDHTWCPCVLSPVCLAAQSLHPDLRGNHHPSIHTQTHTLWHTNTQRGRT